MRLPSFPPLHGDPSLLTGPLWTTWRIDPTVVLAALGLAAVYLYWTGPRNRRAGEGERPVRPGQRAAFLGGAGTMLLALGPPVEDWAGLLLSGHMLQHLLLTLVVPPLLLLGTPEWLLRPLARQPLLGRVGYALTRPAPALLVSSFAFVVWHLPELYDAALRAEALHVLQHGIFLGTGLLAWWPLVGPLPEWPRLSPPLQCVYLFAQTLPGGLVGAFLTQTSSILYPSYLEVPRMWGLGVETDQQIGGLIMWVGTNTLYLGLITVIFFRWAARDESESREGVRG